MENVENGASHHFLTKPKNKSLNNFQSQICYNKNMNPVVENGIAITTITEFEIFKSTLKR